MLNTRSLVRATALLFSVVLLLSAAEERATKNIILITADGLRWQEVFRGIDPLLMNAEEAGMKEAEEVRDRFWAETPQGRRHLLLPFFWSELVKQGTVLGNRDKGSSVRVTNGYRVSYPGYAEILTGRAQDEAVRGNDPIQNPTPTVLEFLKSKWKLDTAQAALFGSWEVFRQIGEHTAGAININAGLQRFEAPGLSGRLRELSRIQFDLLTAWRTVRHDYITQEMALEYLKTMRPRVLYIALGETDDWAHERRYDRTLETAHYFDECVRRIWETVQSMPAYKDKTTLLLTTDHGRGSSLDDWHSHGSDVEGADAIWIAAIGPDTPAGGEVASSQEFFQRDVAATLLELAGIDHREYRGAQGTPIPSLIKP